jgi:gamma-glutamyltranspeptidase
MQSLIFQRRVQPLLLPWQSDVKLGALDDGGFVAAVNGKCPGHLIVVRRFNAGGTAAGAVVAVSASPQSDSTDFAAGIGNDGAVVGWTSQTGPNRSSIGAHQWTPRSSSDHSGCLASQVFTSESVMTTRVLVGDWRANWDEAVS